MIEALGNWEGLMNANSIRRLLLFPIDKLQAAVTLDGGTAPTVSLLDLPDDVVFTEIDFAPGTADLDVEEVTTPHGQAYKAVLTYEIPKLSAALVEWHATHRGQQWGALVQDRNDECYLLGEVANGLRWASKAQTGNGKGRNVMRYSLTGLFSSERWAITSDDPENPFGVIRVVNADGTLQSLLDLRAPSQFNYRTSGWLADTYYWPFDVIYREGTSWIRMVAGQEAAWDVSKWQILAAKGERGEGWSPVLATVADGNRRVLKLHDWIGGTGTKPDTGLITYLEGPVGVFTPFFNPYYVGVNGFTTVLADGMDVRGPIGLSAWTPTIGVVIDGTRAVFQVTDWVGGGGAKPAVGLYLSATGWTATLAQAVTVGGPGPTGNNGWSPLLATITDGDRRVLQVIDWSGGQGAKPTTGLYIGVTGLVAPIANAIDVRGPIGLTGNRGWSPILATVSDGERRVLQVTDWTGGQGTKPSTVNQFVGPVGIVSTAAAAIDVRGPLGGTGNPGTNGLNADVTRSSTSSILSTAIGNTVSFSYAQSLNLGWMVGSRLRVTLTTDTAQYIEGTVSAVGQTGVSLVVAITTLAGGGNSWNLAIAGERGQTGGQGIQGPMPAMRGTINTLGNVATYTNVSGDLYNTIHVTRATANTLKFATGTAGDWVNVLQFGAGQTTFSGDTGVTVVSRPAGLTKTAGQYAMMTAYWATSTLVILTGDLI